MDDFPLHRRTVVTYLESWWME